MAVAVSLAGSGDIRLAPPVLLVTGAVALLLATPAYVILRRFGRETWPKCLLAGFLVGAVVAACVLLPASGFQQIGPDVTVADGVRTAAGWRMYAEAVGIAGGIGAGAGAVFWAVLRLLERAAVWPRMGGLALTAAISLAVGGGWTVFAIPALTMDRSCHNVLRDGRPSISPVLFFTVELAGGEWPRLHDTATRFAAAERMDIDESNDKDKAFSPRRFVSACSEPGTKIMVDGRDWPGTSRAIISVYQPQGGTGWQQPAARLLAAIEAALPGRLRRRLSDAEVQTPSILLPPP